MGIGDFIKDITPDSVEDVVEDGVEWAGDRVEDAGNWTADRLDDVGWESGADWVREQSRSVANRMGAEVDEMDLGQTEDKTKLIYGSSGKLDATVSKLRAFQAAFDSTGDGLKGLDSGQLKGETADALRTAVGTQPAKWYAAADATSKALGALDSFASTVTWAQGQAQTAIDKWKEGVKVSETAADAHRKKVDDFNKAVDRYNAKPSDKRDPSELPPRPASTFEDPGKKLMKDAQDILAEARTQRNSAAQTARTAISAARDMAPKKPSYTEQLGDGFEELQVMGMHLDGGIIKATAGTLNFVRGLNPMDPYNLTHPAEYVTSLNSLAAGLVVAANDPTGTGIQLAKDFMKDPAEGLGRLIPDIALTVATGGGGAAVKGVRVAEEAAEAARLRRLVDDVPEGTHRRPDGERVSDKTDPVDLATGRMYLPQTDVTIPGILPLVFIRRTESGLAIGRFLGPSWTSTVDERLQIDAIGVVHVTSDGLLIRYPHPVPGAPTESERGASRTLLARDANGDYTVTDPDSGLVLDFNAPRGSEPGGDGVAWLADITERNGHRVTIDRDEDGLPLALAHSAGHQVNLSLTDGLVTALTLAGAGKDGTDLPLMSYGYRDGVLATVTKPSGATTTFVHDDRHRVTAWIDSNNSRYDYVYDDQDRVISEGGEAGHVHIALTYTEPDPETGHRTTTLTTADGHTTRHVFGPGCRPLAVTDPLGHTTRFTYGPRGNLLTRTDPLGRTTAFAYDEDDRLISVTRPDGSELSTVRGPFGLPVEAVGADGTRTVSEFDERGNRTAATDPAGATTRYTYDRAGRLTSVTDALGATTQVVCDAAGLPVKATDRAGAVMLTERDALGRPVRATDPVGGVTHLEWHADGQLSHRTGPDSATESWTYDGEGNTLTHTDPSGGVTRFEYTHFDLLAARTGPDGARYEFEHDNELRLTRVTNPQGLAWSYEYDPANRRISETDFDGRTLRYRLDAAGQLMSRTDALGGVLTLEHDRLGRMIRKDTGGRTTTYAYDASGRLLQASGPDGDLIRHYDRRGLLKTELVDGHAITYVYDALGRRSRRVTPTGHATTYAYDVAGRLDLMAASGHQIDFTHDSADREVSRSYGDTMTLSFVRDEAGRPSAQYLTAGGRTLNSRTYAYRADGHLTAVDDQLSGSRSFELDNVGRVTAVHADRWTERYAYDLVGNQTQASWPSTHPGHETTGPRTYTGTTITRAGNSRFEHDRLGRVVLRQRTRLSRKPQTWRYAWDSESRLTSVVTPDGTLWKYRYDPLGRRIAKQLLADDGETVLEETRFTWDGMVLCEQTTVSHDLPHIVALTWDHRGSTPLAQTDRILCRDAGQREIDRRFFAIVTDLVGTPTELVAENGDIAWHTRSTLWGTTAWSRSSTAYTPLRFPGQYHDPETGLHYNLFRHYDPTTARYLTPDPLGLAPAPNPATYVQNPHAWTDPLGLSPCEGKGRNAEVDPRKLDYLFNKNIKADSHNSPRALQNELQLNRIGIPDTPEMRKYVTDHLAHTAEQPFGRTFSKEWDGGSGDFGVTESVLYGPHGALGVESTWQILPDGAHRLSTVIFRGSGPNVSIHGSLKHWPPYSGK